MKKNFMLLIDRRLAGRWYKQLEIPLIAFLFVIIVFVIIFYYSRGGTIGERFAQAFVDMTNPEHMSREVYGDNTNVNYKRIRELGLVYVFGTIVFTGLLIATISSIWRSRSDKFRRGAVNYRFSDHIVFLGYNELVPGMIQKICEDNTDVRIVVGVENDASSVCDKIKNRLYNDYRDCVVVLKADSCNRKDLTRLRVVYAEVVYIIGEHDDAYNLKSYRTIYELSLCDSSSKARMPQCYVNLHSQATLTLFRTYASANELGVDFTEFQSFSFFDEWARMMIQKNWRNDEKRREHFVIAGMTEMGIAFARKVALLCHKPSEPNNDNRTIITLIDNNVATKAKHFIIQNQDFFDCCLYTIKDAKGCFKPEYIDEKDLLDVEFEFIDGDLAHDEIREYLAEIASDSKKSKTLSICYDSHQYNIAMGLSLPEIYYGDNSDARVWVYQPTFGDLGKYMKNDRYARFVTFGMSGYDLDLRNEERDKNAKLINHFFRHVEDNSMDFNNGELIKREWENTSIAKRWICIRHAEYIPFLSPFNDGKVEKMVCLEKNRSTVDKYLFGERDLYSHEIDFHYYFKKLKNIIPTKETN